MRCTSKRFRSGRMRRRSLKEGIAVRFRHLVNTSFSVFAGAVIAFSPAFNPYTAHAGSATAHPAFATDAVSSIQINEIVYKPAQGGVEWVELKNTGASPANARGYQLTDEDNNIYVVPDALPDVPAGAFIVIIFDGLGSAGNDYNFGDNAATLHSQSGLVNIFEDAADQAALYTRDALFQKVHLPSIFNNFSAFNPVVPGPPNEPAPPKLISFAAWGADPGADAAQAVKDGAWGAGVFIGTNVAPGGDPVLAGGSIGVLGNQPVDAVSNWVIYRPSETTQGSTNPLPAPFFRNPVAGASITDHQVVFGWSVVDGAASYTLQVDNDPAFGSPEVNVTVAASQFKPASPLADGTFYFRVKANGALSSAFSPAASVNFVSEPIVAQGEQSIQVLLGVTPKLQHKDTLMLDLSGDTETGTSRWDSAHETDADAIAGNGVPVRANQHDNMYCTRASISMIVAYHGGKLSQDRIAYQAYAGSTSGDLGNGVGLWPNEIKTQGTGKNIFDWAMNGNAVTSSRGKPTFAQVRGWIDANRPMLTVENNDSHSVVLDGYQVIAGKEYAHRVDPWTASGSWVLYSTWQITEYHAPPAGVTPRSDEDQNGNSKSDALDDTDGDGVSDFDEDNRFQTDKNKVDTDGDRVNDKQDIREYVFNVNGVYNLQNADMDADGKRKELDSDNDYAANNGSDDGCEDPNYNGKYEIPLGETSNFNPADDIRLHIRLDWPLLGSDVDLHLVRPGGTYFTAGDTFFMNPNPDWGMPGNTCDDPTLDVDCITQCTVENIRLGKLEDGVYQVKVHYYSDHDQGPTAPRVSLWFRGVAYAFGPRGISDGDVWDVATVKSDGTVTLQNSVLLNVTHANASTLVPSK